MNAVKKITLAIGLFLLLFIAANFSYVQKNILFYFRHPAPLQQTINGPIIKTAEPNMLSIPSLSITAPIVYATGSSETVFQTDLKNGVVHYPGTANPGQSGNCYIFGHSSDYVWSSGKFKTVFATLPHIQKGAEIQVSNKDGLIFTYIVTNITVVSPSATQYLEQDTTKKILTVQTSYPIGTALKRFLVIAELKQ